MARSGKSFSHLRLNLAQILNSNRKANQPVANPLAFLLCRTDIAMRGRSRMTASGRGIAEGWTERNAFRFAHEAIHRVSPALEFEGDHVAVGPVQNAASNLVVGVIRATGIDYPADCSLFRQPVREGSGIGGAGPHTQGKGR